MPHSLVLNASYEPLCVVPVRRALILVLNDKATCLEASGTVLHSATRTVAVPSVIRLSRFVRVPYRGHVPLTRRALFARDGGRCVYCGQAATSVDHVVPRSRGGPHTWENVVSACRRCNHVKGDRYVAELGWRMSRAPVQPSGLAWRIIGTGFRDPRWDPYLAPYGADDHAVRASHALGQAAVHGPSPLAPAAHVPGPVPLPDSAAGTPLGHPVHPHPHPGGHAHAHPRLDQAASA